MTFSWSSTIFVFLKKDIAAVLKSSKIEGVRLPFSKMSASLPPINVVRGARPGRAGTDVEDMEYPREESEEADVFGMEVKGED
jgi:hypothetical protein